MDKYEEITKWRKIYFELVCVQLSDILINLIT
jgi:hypothetical protein